MNTVIIMGRIANDISPRYTDSGMCITNIAVAVNRPKKQGEAKPQADFIDCVAFGKTAETIGNFFKKGERILVEGRIQTNSYEKDGKKIKTTNVVINTFEFIEPPKKQESKQPSSFSDFGQEDIMF